MSAPLVLIVNDHAASLYLVGKLLRAAGFRTAEARTGHDALAAARAGDAPPAVVLLDVHLPDLSGLEVCRRLKSDPDTRAIKIVHTSAATVTPENRQHSAEAGADGYLAQPFQPEDLVAAVRAVAAS